LGPGHNEYASLGKGPNIQNLSTCILDEPCLCSLIFDFASLLWKIIGFMWNLEVLDSLHFFWLIIKALFVKNNKK
jgi:hypothetical protein